MYFAEVLKFKSVYYTGENYILINSSWEDEISDYFQTFDRL